MHIYVLMRRCRFLLFAFSFDRLLRNIPSKPLTSTSSPQNFGFLTRASEMKLVLVLIAAFLGLAAAGPAADYVPFQPALGRRCTFCDGDGVDECCVQQSACGTPGCNE
jgi:hypothetical protein